MWLGNPGVHEDTGASANGNTARVYFLANLTSPQSIQEVVTNLRQVVQINHLFASPEKLAIALRGTAEQVALASWLIDQSDVTAGKAGVHEYPGSSADGELARVFYLTNATSPRDLQEVITTSRQVVEINHIFSLLEKGAIALRATPVEAGLAEWLIHGTPQIDRELMMAVRTKAGVSKAFNCSKAHAIAVRGSANQIAMVQQLIADQAKAN